MTNKYVFYGSLLPTIEYNIDFASNHDYDHKICQSYKNGIILSKESETHNDNNTEINILLLKSIRQRNNHYRPRKLTKRSARTKTNYKRDSRKQSIKLAKKPLPKLSLINKKKKNLKRSHKSNTKKKKYNQQKGKSRPTNNKKRSQTLRPKQQRRTIKVKKNAVRKQKKIKISVNKKLIKIKKCKNIVETLAFSGSSNSLETHRTSFDKKSLLFEKLSRLLH